MWNNIIEYVKVYPVWLIDLVVGAGVGFLVGFIFKMFGKPLLYVTLVLSIANYFFYYFGFIEFHTEALINAFGMEKMLTLDELFSLLISWASQHIIACCSAFFAMLIGWRIG